MIPRKVMSVLLCCFLSRTESWILPHRSATLSQSTRHTTWATNPLNSQSPLPKRKVSEKKSSLTQCNLALGPFGLETFGPPGYWQVAVGFNVIAFLALRFKLKSMLTDAGYFHAMALGIGLWSTLGWKGWTLCVAYLFLGQAVTKVKFAEKEKKGIAEGRGGRRGPENVWGSAATGIMCGLGAALNWSGWGILTSGRSTTMTLASLWKLGFVASLATKLSDTFASEIGKAYGKTTFLITTLQKVEPGTEGAVSAEGTAASVVGGLLLSLYGAAIGMIPVTAIPISAAAAFIATNIESVLGATLQGKPNLEWISNELVNFINTLIGAIVAMGAGLVFL